MALTPAERTRAFRERQRAQERASLQIPPKSATYLKTPFSEYIGDRTIDLDENLDAFGIRIMGNFLSEEIQHFDSEFERDEPLNALERATGLVGVFLDAAKELAVLIHLYKLEEIERAIEEAVEYSANLPRGDVAALKASWAEMDRLKAIRSELRKPTRHTVVGITASGE